jgi:hypothetical protein
MLIEKDARKRIVAAIELETEVREYERVEKLKGKVVLSCDAYHELRRKLVEICCQLNSIANPDGKGRDDLSVDILLAAEGISRRVSLSQSRAVRHLADQIKASFTDFRELLRKFADNIELVDPQLKNNPDLVAVLTAFEKSWEKGKEFFLNGKLCNMLIYFSRLIEGVTEKYKELREKIESADTDVFVILPCLVVLNGLNGDDKGLCRAYYPVIGDGGSQQQHYDSTRSQYEGMKRRCRDEYQLYNIVEQSILDRNIPETQLRRLQLTQEQVKQLVHDIKLIAIGMQRHQPAEWNSLMAVAMNQ